MLTPSEKNWLLPLVDHPGGRPANAHRDRSKEVLGELARNGLVTLGACRTGIALDPDMWWVTITEAGREALVVNA